MVDGKFASIVLPEFLKPAHISQSTAASFVEGLQYGSRWAWQRLVDGYGPYIYADCRRAAFDAADSEDVTQEVLIRVSRRNGTFQRDSFRGWLKVITKRQQADARRVAARQLAVAVGGGSQRGELDDAAAPKAALSESEPARPSARPKELRRVIQAVKASTNPKTWRVFAMQVIEGCSAEETASACGVSSSNAYVIRHRMVKRLRSRIEGEVGERK